MPLEKVKRRRKYSHDLQHNMQFKSLLALASLVTLAFGSNVGDILADLSNVKNLIVTFDNAVKGFSNSDGTGVTQLTVLHLLFI